MTNIKPAKILIVTNSNIFFECIKRVLTFTLKTEFIQSEDYELITKQSNKKPKYNYLILDVRFSKKIGTQEIKKLKLISENCSNLYVFVDSGANINSIGNIRIIKPYSTSHDINTMESGHSDISNSNMQLEKDYKNILTKKEKVIADLISKGLNNKEIASRQDISEKTVKAHLTNIYRKLHIKNRFELMLSTQRNS